MGEGTRGYGTWNKRDVGEKRKEVWGGESSMREGDMAYARGENERKGEQYARGENERKGMWDGGGEEDMAYVTGENKMEGEQYARGWKCGGSREPHQFIRV